MWFSAFFIGAAARRAQQKREKPQTQYKKQNQIWKICSVLY